MSVHHSHAVMKYSLIVLVLFLVTGDSARAQVQAQLQPVVSGAIGSNTGQQIMIEFPGYIAMKHGDGTGTKPCPNPPGGINCQGIWTIYDLKNDPSKQYQWGAQDTGLSQHQWNSVKNSDGSLRWSEVKEGGQPCEITETNNVRTLLSCSGPVYPYGSKAGYPTPDCCVKLTKTYSIYRHGGAGTGKGGLKIYTQTSLLYDGADKKGPLSLTNNNLYTDFMWALVSGENLNGDHTTPPHCGHFGVLTPSPLNLQYQNPGSQGSKDYNLLVPGNANSSRPGEYLGANLCASSSGRGASGPEGTADQPASGTVFRCNGPTVSACASQTSLGRILNMNILQISREPITYMNLGDKPPAAFFMGGVRFQNFLPEETLSAGVPKSWASIFYLGDNGVNTTRIADELTLEYKKAIPKITVRNGSGAGFDAHQGYWAITKSNGPLSLVASGDLHSPAFYVTGWSADVPPTVTVGSSTRSSKTLNTDFVAAKVDDSHLLFQLLSDVPKGQPIDFGDSSKTTANALGRSPGSIQISSNSGSAEAVPLQTEFSSTVMGTTGLLTGKTPYNFAIPTGWNLWAKENFEAGSCVAGTWCSGNFTSTHYHGDGNAGHTHALTCTYGNPTGKCVGSGLNWNKFLPIGTREVYVSFYEWLSPSFRMNDEMFLMRFHWDVGNGQPLFREAILDYFQNTSGTYNSTNAVLLWNIQGQPYYQNRLPGNTRSDPTNWTIATGRWVQHEMYVKFSTVSGKIAIPGTVTLNGSTNTYTRTTGSWITDGVTVGSSPHFTGFSGDANNGGGASGGGATSYFVTAVTDKVLTVDDKNNSLRSEGPVSGATLQIDRNNGAYAYYKDGVRVAYQNKMINPGKVDFAKSDTTLSLMESYSKLIWRAPINGSCQTKAPFTTACSTRIGYGACGYQQIPYGWNSYGYTRSSSTGTFNIPISCSKTAGGPMPNPPVFSRYLDDVIVLTK